MNEWSRQIDAVAFNQLIDGFYCWLDMRYLLRISGETEIMKAIINNINRHGDKLYSCSDCGNNEISEEHKYCSQCGKKIDGFIHTFAKAGEEIKNDRT